MISHVYLGTGPKRTEEKGKERGKEGVKRGRVVQKRGKIPAAYRAAQRKAQHVGL